MKVLASLGSLCLALAALPAWAWVVATTGIAPRFPKADAELEQHTRPQSRRWLTDAIAETKRMRRRDLWGGAGDLEMQVIAPRPAARYSAIPAASRDLCSGTSMQIAQTSKCAERTRSKYGHTRIDHLVAEGLAFFNDSTLLERLVSVPPAPH
jgi:hypothetical protein